MNQEKVFAEAYDRIEAMEKSDSALQPDGTDSEMTDYLRVVQLLRRDAAKPITLPRSESFLAGIRFKIRRPQRLFLRTGLALAAVLILGFLFLSRPTLITSGSHAEMVLGDEVRDRTVRRQTKILMLDYLETTERLLLAMRDHDVHCGQEDLDFSPEKQLASGLLIQQKLISPEMKRAEFFQARELFNQLELILVDVNNLEQCTDAVEIDTINQHINESRILSKLRLIAQDLEIS